MEKGTIFKFHNDLDTDQIIASQYLLLPNLDEMKGHTYEVPWYLRSVHHPEDLYRQLPEARC